MKKKAIEKIPYMEPPRAGKKYTHVAAQKQVEFKGESHLIVEIFKNVKEGRKLPAIRIVATKTDWGLYYPEEGGWTEQSLRTANGWDAWHKTYRKGKPENATYMAPEDQDAIWDWCGGSYQRKYMGWEDRLQRHCENIRHARANKRMENRMKRLEERIRDTPELPEDLEEWADRKLFKSEHYLYYKRNGRYADICCSKCGQVSTVATKRKDTFEGQFERVTEPPRNGYWGTCPSCHCNGIWKAQGKTRGVWAQKKHFFIGMPYKEAGAVIRYVQCEKMYRMDEVAGEKGAQMIGASERLTIVEIARRYIEKGKKSQTDFQKFSPYEGKDFWDDCNLYGLSNITIDPAAVYEKTWEMLKGTDLQYSGAEWYIKEKHQINLADYMERYMECPQMEMLSKMGLVGVVDKMLRYRYPDGINKYASRPEDFLGINKDRIKLLAAKKGNPEYLRAMQAERRLQAHWSGGELKMVLEARIERGGLELAMEYMSMKQLKNRLEKYSGVSIGDGELCTGAAAALQSTARTYFDYLNMRRQRGYDLHNTVFLFPKDLRGAHDKMVQEVNQEQIEKRDREIQGKYPSIQKNYRKLRKMYFYEDADFLIRPARSAEEIVKEGRELHHCVGGDTYLSRHDKGESTVLFLRPKAAPETPYVTVEIKGDGIRQWYGAYDKKPDKERIQEWLDAYIRHLRGGQEEERARVMAAG